MSCGVFGLLQLQCTQPGDAVLCSCGSVDFDSQEAADIVRRALEVDPEVGWYTMLRLWDCTCTQ